MRKQHSDETVRREAELILSTGAKYSDVSHALNIPLSTVGWHMKYRLTKLDPELARKVAGVVQARTCLRAFARAGLSVTDVIAILNGTPYPTPKE